MTRLTLSLFVSAAAVLQGCRDWRSLANEQGPNHVLVVDVAPDGKYLAAIDRAGRISVWDLNSQRVVSSLEKIQRTDLQEPGYSGMALRGTTGEVLYECKWGTLCSHSIGSGLDSSVVDLGDPNDRVHRILSSADGRRIAIGTLAGRVLTLDSTTSSLRERKPKDIWSPPGNSPEMIYLLEGPPYLGVFASATTGATGAGKDEREHLGERHESEGWLDFGTYQGALWLGTVIWPFEAGREQTLTLDLGFRVRGDFSPDGKELAICEEGGPWVVVDTADLSDSGDISLNRKSRPSCYGIRFLDLNGEFLGVTGGREARLWLARRSQDRMKWEDAGTITLRSIPGLGPRSMTALPERGWLFIGLMSGGVDWYQFYPGAHPRLDLLAHLSDKEN